MHTHVHTNRHFVNKRNTSSRDGTHIDVTSIFWKRLDYTKNISTQTSDSNPQHNERACADVYVHMCVCVCVCLYVYMFICMYVYTRTRTTHTYTHTHSLSHTHTQTYVHTFPPHARIEYTSTHVGAPPLHRPED